MKDIEFTAFIRYGEGKDLGNDFLIRLTGVTEDYGFEPDYIIEESKSELEGFRDEVFVIPIVLSTGYNPRFEGIAMYELDSYKQSTKNGIRGIATYVFTGTAGWLP